MWFKNLKLYRLTQTLDFTPEDLEQKLEDGQFRPCGSQEIATMGWVPPLPQGKQLVHVGEGKWLLTLKKQERILPASVIKDELQQRVEKIESETGSPVGKKAQSELKQEITQQLLPKAFTRDSVTFGFIDTKENLVVLDASADGKAETFLAYLRKSIGSLPVVPLARRSISPDLTLWLKGESNIANFEILEEAELKSMEEDGAIIRCKNQPLDAQEIQLHLESGKSVQKLALSWNESISILLQEDLTVKRLKFADVLKEQNDDIPKDQQLAKLDADFCLMSGEVIRLAQELEKAFGLEQE